MVAGKVILFLTDGAPSRSSPSQILARVGRLVEKLSELTMAELGNYLLKATFEHGAGVKQADDITLVLIKRRQGEKGE